MNTPNRLRILEECGPEPSEQWIRSVMERIRAEAAIIPFPCTKYTAERFVRRFAGAAAAAAALIAVIGWASLPTNEELAWKAQTGGYVSEYFLLAEK